MSDPGKRYVLDSGVLIQAHRNYYAFDICTGFWEAILKHHNDKLKVVSIDKAFDEIIKGKVEGKGDDELQKWVKNKVPATFFCDTNDINVMAHYKEAVNWVNGQKYTQEAKAEFMEKDNCDPYLIAYAKANNMTLITQETSEPARLNKVKIPDVCFAVGVVPLSTYDLLRILKVKLKI